MYESLTRYLPEFDKVEGYGEWVIDHESKGTMDDPIQMPYVDYGPLVMGVYDAIYTFEEGHLEYGLNRYNDILERMAPRVPRVQRARQVQRVPRGRREWQARQVQRVPRDRRARRARQEQRVPRGRRARQAQRARQVQRAPRGRRARQARRVRRGLRSFFPLIRRRRHPVRQGILCSSMRTAHRRVRVSPIRRAAAIFPCSNPVSIRLHFTEISRPHRG